MPALTIVQVRFFYSADILTCNNDLTDDMMGVALDSEREGHTSGTSESWGIEDGSAAAARNVADL